MKTIVFASRNAHKKAELSVIFKQKARLPFHFIAIDTLEKEWLHAFSLLQENSLFFEHAKQQDILTQDALTTCRKVTRTSPMRQKLQRLVSLLSLALERPFQPEETGESFFENAFIKAKDFHRYLLGFQEPLQKLISPAKTAGYSVSAKNNLLDFLLRFLKTNLSQAAYNLSKALLKNATKNEIQKNLQPKKLAQASSLFYTLAEDSGLCVPLLNGAPGIHSARYAQQAHPPIHPQLKKPSPANKKQHLTVASPSPEQQDKRNREKLCQELKQKSLRHAPAYFHCTMLLYSQSPSPSPSPSPRSIAKQPLSLSRKNPTKDYSTAIESSVFAETGYLNGVVKDHETGEHGFGYDSMFSPDIKMTPQHPAPPASVFSQNLKDKRFSLAYDKRFSLAQLSASQKNAISHRAKTAKNFLRRLPEFL